MNEWRDQVRKILTDWMFRMETLGQLRDFTNRKQGFWIFECPDLETYIAKVEKDAFDRGVKSVQQQAQRSPGWLRSEIHRRLNLLFPGKEYDRARYRWLRSHSLTTEHMSQMKYDELKLVNKKLGELLAQARNQ